jgi:dephospho-CoA kinase
MTLIIMISGWAGSGKDAAASILMDELGFQRFAFADPLKHDVARDTGIPLENFNTTYLKDKYILFDGKPTTPRALLIKAAAEARAKYPNIYANMIADSIQLSGAKRVVISDWRYRNEYDVIKTFFDQIVRIHITRPGIMQSSEPSEHDLDGEPMDIEIQNGGSISILRSTLKDLVRPYISKGTQFGS